MVPYYQENSVGFMEARNHLCFLVIILHVFGVDIRNFTEIGKSALDARSAKKKESTEFLFLPLLVIFQWKNVDIEKNEKMVKIGPTLSGH